MVLRILAGAAASFQLALQTRNLVFVPVEAVRSRQVGFASRSQEACRWCTRSCGSELPPVPSNLLGFDLGMLLLQGVYFSADHFNLLDVSGDC